MDSKLHNRLILNFIVKIVGVVISSSALFTGCSSVQEEIKPTASNKNLIPYSTPTSVSHTEFNIIPDITYAKIGDKNLQLDMYYPTGKTNVPVIVWIHGGGFVEGNKEGVFLKPQQLLDRGYALASINYRLSFEANFPAQIFDCKAAVRWIRAHSEEYNINPENIGVWGESAGAYLASFLGVTNGNIELEGTSGNLEFSSKVQAVCHFYGPVDFLTFDGACRPGSYEEKLIGSPILENKEKAKRASPINYVSKNSPPFLIMHGKKDSSIPYSQSEQLDNALKDAGVTSELVLFDNAEHVGDEFYTEENVNRVVDFFDKYLKKTK